MHVHSIKELNVGINRDILKTCRSYPKEDKGYTRVVRLSFDNL